MRWDEGMRSTGAWLGTRGSAGGVGHTGQPREGNGAASRGRLVPSRGGGRRLTADAG